MKTSSLIVGSATLLALALSAFAPACGGNGNSSFSNNGNGSGGSGSGGPSGSLLGPGSSGGSGGGADGGPCTGIQCQIHSCASGSTTISGTVYDPAGNDPLYDVVVYVPNSTPDPLTPGIDATSCSCDALYTGQPIATALTDATGKFTINNAPDGANIPLVIQIGKWRRQLVIPTVTQCAANPQPDKSLTLPKNQKEGDIPSIAVSTGSADSLECLLLRVGVDPAEYGGGAGGTGRIHIFQGGNDPTDTPNTNPPGPASNANLWDSAGDINKYDIVLLSCEGSETYKPSAQTVYNYVNGGGRLFAEHYHYVFFGPTLTEPSPGSPPFPTDLATWTPDNTGADEYQTPIGGAIQTGFPKGVALNTWLGVVNALTVGQLPIAVGRHNALVGAANTPSTAWIQSGALATPASTQYFSFDMPFNAPLDDAGEPEVCGRVVYSDLHVGAEETDYASGALVTPTGCVSGELSPDEKALEFMLFDLSSCVTPIGSTPQPPPTTGPTPK
ncbi:MAG: carboxypeptidase regulatory-like domain-containing protein [Polyangiaceae bacterium]|jgi:hypothetical protein